MYLSKLVKKYFINNRFLNILNRNTLCTMMMNFGKDLEQDITLHIQLIGQRLLA